MFDLIQIDENLLSNIDNINKKWSLIYIFDNQYLNNFNLDLLKITIQNLKIDFNINEIIFYISNDNEILKKNLEKKFEDIIILNFLELNPKILFDYLKDKKNIIIISNKYYYIKNSINNNNISIKHIVLNLKKNENKKIIDLSIIIIPYNNFFFNLIFGMSKKNNNLIKILNDITIKYNNIIDNINNYDFFDNFIISNSKYLKLILYENLIENNTNYNKNIDYDNYYFYPYFDLDNSNKRLIYSKDKNIIIFNSNNFVYDNIPSNIFYNLFKRFNKKTDGIYISKNFLKINNNIPKILHYVWFFEEINSNYINLWKNYLNDTWEYIIWDKNKILDNLKKNNKWLEIYNQTKELNKLYLIIIFSILEKYGGIIINSNIIPLLKIPDILLSNNFFISFMDENKNNLELSYNVIGSLPGIIEDEEEKTLYDPARKPFEGINNFFRDIKRKKNKNNKNINNQALFNNFIRILKFEKNYIESLDLLLKIQNNILILPSYYFNNNNNYLFQENIMMIINKNNDKYIEDDNKKIERQYIHDEKSINFSLNENPRDRLKNIR